MTLHELTIAMEDKDFIYYTDNDGDIVEAYVENITNDGDVIIVTWHGTRYRVTLEELSV